MAWTLIVARMLRKIKIETAGDTNLLAGMVVDKFDFRKANDAVSKCLKIKSSGDSGFEEGSIVPKDVFQETNDFQWQKPFPSPEIGMCLF